MAASRYGLVDLGNNRFTAGEKGVLRVMTLRPDDGAGVAGVPVTVRLRPDDSGLSSRMLSTGLTDALGEHVASFTFSEKEVGGATLEVTAGSRQSSHTILIERERNVLLTTDKPLYQPGQTVHIRALAMGQPRLAPTANEPLLIEVEDSQGNKLFKKDTKTDDHGIASLRFQLARLEAWFDHLGGLRRARGSPRCVQLARRLDDREPAREEMTPAFSPVASPAAGR